MNDGEASDPEAWHQLIANYRGALIRVSGDDVGAVRTVMADVLNGLGITNGEPPPPADDLHRGIFLLDIEHDPAALQALETYAYAVNVQGDRPLCDELMEKISEVKKRRKA